VTIPYPCGQAWRGLKGWWSVVDGAEAAVKVSKTGVIIWKFADVS